MSISSPLVSVIVPVYNVSAFIEKCARSLFEQTLGNLEIIFVDDCSPDNSIEILEKILNDYPLRKTQTKILQNSINLGLPATRKVGLSNSNGDYIIHCDADDWVDDDLYEKMLNEAVKNDSDIVFCDFVREFENHQELSKVVLRYSSGKELIKNWYHLGIGLFCWNKLVKASLYKNNAIYPWEGLNMWEDNGLFSRLLYHSNKISQIRGPVYHYNRANVNAMTSGYGIKQVNQMIGNAENIWKFFESKHDAEEFKDTVNAFKYLARLNLVTDSWTNYRRFLKTFPESKYIASKIDKNAFSRKGNFRFQMVKHGLAPLFVFMFKVRNLLHL